MGNIKRFHPASFKAKVALELIKEIDPVAAVCSKYGIQPRPAATGKKQLLGGVENLFSDKPSNQLKEKDETIDELYKQIGQLKVELDWLKKNYQFEPKQKLKLLEPWHRNISIVCQCQPLGLNRSNYYYRPAPVSEEERRLMRKLDEIYTELPFYSSPRITREIRHKGFRVSHKTVERLRRK